MKQLQTYAKLGPENISNKLYLIEAEKSTLKGDTEDARKKFRMSIDYAHQQGFIHEEALAYERYAIAVFEWGEATESLEFFERARKLYKEWGSMMNVKRLEKYIREQCGIRNSVWE